LDREGAHPHLAVSRLADRGERRNQDNLGAAPSAPEHVAIAEEFFCELMIREIEAALREGIDLFGLAAQLGEKGGATLEASVPCVDRGVEAFQQWGRRPEPRARVLERGRVQSW
jgi:hypothetical protein